jgi:hypothetical protein
LLVVPNVKLFGNCRIGGKYLCAMMRILPSTGVNRKCETGEGEREMKTNSE